MSEYYLISHILIGFYAVDWYCSHFNRLEKKYGAEVKYFKPQEVIAMYIFWPILIPFLLAVFYWPTKRKQKND